MAISHAWLGAVTTTSALIKARSDQVSVSATTNPVTDTFNGVEGNDDVFTIELSGLTANTTYEVTVDDGDGTWVATFSTFPSGVGSFMFAVGGDSGHGGGGFNVSGVSPNAPTWDSIAEDVPLFMIHLGDLHYRNISTDNVGAFRSAYQDVIAQKCATMLQSVPIAYVWDDHDFGANDSNGTSASKPAAAEAYRDWVPHYPLSDPTGVWQTFVCGRVRFILTDSRSEKVPKSNTDNADKTMLGADQKAWLFDLLGSVTEPLIVLGLPNPWIGNASAGADWWAGYSTERREIAEEITANGLAARILVISADAHMIAFDDGSHTQYDPEGGAWGPRLIQCGKIDAGTINIGGPYSEGIHNESNQMYVTVEVTDDGDDVSVTARGWAVSGTTETEVTTLTFTAGEFPPEPPPADPLVFTPMPVTGSPSRLGLIP